MSAPIDKQPAAETEEQLNVRRSAQTEMTGKTSEVEAEDLDEEVDADELFQAFDDGEPAQPSGRPDDYPGSESMEVLLTAGGPYKAGKSYRPDPSGARRAVKVDDYSLGTKFLPDYA